MPKMYSKQSALQTILAAGEALSRVAAEKNLDTMTVGKGELRQLLNRENRRGKSILSLAIQRFAATKLFATPRWMLEVVDPDKPLLIFRKR